jgi:hypothetical protein
VTSALSAPYSGALCFLFSLGRPKGLAAALIPSWGESFS